MWDFKANRTREKNRRTSLMKWDDLPRTPAGIFDLIEANINAHISWYRRKKRRVQIYALGIRTLSIALFFAGTLAPFLPATTLGYDFKTLGYFLFGISGALMLFDRTFGFTSSWSRLLKAALLLEAKQLEYRLQWSAHRATSGNATNVESAVSLATAQSREIQQIIDVETASWSLTTDKALAGISEASRSRPTN
ncbi:SLATT domain-containing protein [Roseomonas sp. KE2513]|uniref:SLATT domain-containing protein n=1 Tax=Roseomonas sp. KE2513 TaxID=2479202 RepID=UPI0028164B1D|nr:SLATT domain-containing protein [Roseomonas sp. KE2513]MBI0534709.1 SLATT domain-containing protein [Roseomonas sp. KE2513]